MDGLGEIETRTEKIEPIMSDSGVSVSSSKMIEIEERISALALDDNLDQGKHGSEIQLKATLRGPEVTGNFGHARPGQARAECTVRVEEKIKGFRANEVSSIYFEFSETNETTLVNEYTRI